MRGSIVVRATEAEKQSQLDRLADFQARHAAEAPAALRRLQDVATGDVLEVDAVRGIIHRVTGEAPG